MAEETELPRKPINLNSGSQDIPVYTPVGPGSMDGGSAKLSSDDIYAGIQTKSGALPNVSGSSIPDASRYNTYIPGRNMEEMYGQQQGAWEKWGNGFGKMLGNATTSFLNGTVGTVYGIGAMIKDARAASFYDNQFSRGLDKTNQYLENYLPNYYTQNERSASWYSPDNILTANFFSDKVLKNLGFSLGSLGAGFAWGGILKSIGLTNRLVQAGKGLETVEAVENAIATAPKIGRYGAINNALTGLSNQYLKPIAATALKNADRSLTSVLGTMGEASFESLQNLNSVRDKMIQNYINKFGAEPTGEALDEINDYSEKVGNFTWGMNVALLSATNYIQLPKILNSSKVAERRMVNSIVKETLEEGATVAEKAAAKYIKAPSLLESIAGKPGRLFNKYVVNPASLFFAPIEAFEEGAQFAIQVGTDNYFSRAYNVNDDVSSFWENVSGAFENVLGEGVSETLSSKEGLESILIGGLSGGIQTSFSPFGKSTIRERGLFGDGGVRGTNTAEAIKAINDSKNINEVLKDGVKYANIAINSQKLRQQDIENNDTLNEKDHEQDYALAYIMPRVKYGKADSIKEEINLYKQQALTDEGFQELQNNGVVINGETKEKFLQRLESINQTTAQVNKMFEMFDDKYSVLVDKDGKRLFSDELIEKMTYASAKVINYDERTSDLQSKLATQGVFTSALDQALMNSPEWKSGDIKGALNNESVQDAILEVSTQVDGLQSILEDDILDDLSDYVDLTIRRKYFLEEFNKIKSNPEQFKSPEPILKNNGETISDEEKETITLKTQDGEEEIEVGTEYFLGKSVKKTEGGKNVYAFPKFTVIGETEDGKIQIKDNTGIREVSKTEFANYKLGKVSDTLSNKKAKFFLDNINEVFNFNFGKDKGGKIKGRLEYSPKEGILLFTYKDRKTGKIKSIEVTGDQFVVKKGYKQAMITPVMKLEAAKQKSLNEFSAEKDARLEAKNAARLKILTDLFDELSDTQSKTTSLIEKKQSEIAKIKQELASLEEEIANAEVDKRAKNTVRFKSATKKALANAIRLSRMRDELENEVTRLEADQEEIEFNLAYVSDLAQNIDVMPTESAAFLEELNDQVLDLELLQEKTGKQISIVSSLLKETEKALNSAIDFVTNLIEKFENKYPNVPRIMGQDFIDFLKTNPNFLKLKPYYREELNELEDLIATIEEGDVTVNETKLEQLKEHLDVIQGDLVELQKEIVAKKTVLDRFQEVADRYKEQKDQEKKLQASENLLQQFLGTLGGYSQTQVSDKTYEASSKKSEKEVVTSTRPSDPNDNKKPFNIRVNRFGFNFKNLVNKDKIRGVVVNNTTQNDIIPGLTEHLLEGATAKQKEKYKAKDIIVLVITDENGKPVDENGVTIPEGADLLNTAIYQVFPTSELMGTYNGNYESMFRKGIDPALKTSLEKEYSEWRDKQLKQETLGKPQSIGTSFGIPEYATYKDQSGKDHIDYNARNSVQDSGLITVNENKDDLTETQAVVVATTNDSITHDNTTFDTPLGGVFLKVAGGLYKLFNRKFNNKEASTIFDVIHQLSKNALTEGKVGPESTNLINWLKSVVYWGINKTEEGERKKAGYNSIWFETVKEDGKKVTRLFISGKETDSTKQFEFTPSGLEQRKDEIILLLSNMYSNTDAKLTTKDTYNKPYLQITGIDSEGKAITTKWPNYQSYLLSNKSPDATGKLTVARKNDEIPLTTPIRALKDSDDVNKKGFFFTLQGPNEFTFVSKTPEAKAKEQAPVSDVETKEAVEEKYILDGEKVNEIKLNGNTGTIEFSANIEKINYNTETGEISGELAINANDTTKNNIATILKSQGKIAEDASVEEIEKAVKSQLSAKVISEIKPQLEAAALSKMKPEIIEAAPINVPFTEEETKQQDKELDDIISSVKDIEDDEDDEVYRVELAKRAELFTPEKWEDIKAFIAKVLPNIPFYRLKNVIETTNGKQAWGMFKNGAIYVYENAEVGTAYHEVFEAVWKMFSNPKEKAAIIKEFKDRAGTFVDRETGETIKYSEATAKQAKEELAEEFRTFVLTGEVKTITKEKSFIARLFSDLVNFIKEFFTGEQAISNTQELFEKITGGYYAQYNPYQSNLSYANKGIIDIETAEAGGNAEFRIKTIPAQQVSDIVDHMAYSTLAELSKTNDSLFSATSFENKSQLLKRLKEEVLLLVAKQIKLQKKNIDGGTVDQNQGNRDIANMVDLYKNIQSEWDNLSKRYEEKLKTLSIEFDENDNLLRTDEDNSGKSDYIDARKIDNFRKSNGAIKLLFGTLAQAQIKDGKLKKIPSSIGGARLIPADRVFITLKNALYDSLNVDEMFARLKAMGETDPNYAMLYHRITRNNIDSNKIDFSNLQDHDLQLISAFWKSMKGQNADVLSVFILSSGQVVIGDSNLSQASRQAKRELTNNIIASIKVDNPFVKYNIKTKTYSAAKNTSGEKVVDNYKLNASQLQSYISFLDKLGVTFKQSDLENKLTSDQFNEFISAVNGIKQSLSKVKDLSTLSSNSLGIDGRLLQLGAIQSIIENPEFESTYFNVNGERTQTYLGVNALSNLYDVLSKLNNIKELEGTQYAYLLTDVFSKGDASVLLNTMFNVTTTGNRKPYTQELLKPVYIDGTINDKKNKKKESSKLSIKERIIQEINLNINGVFMNLVPGDASIEWAIRMHKEKSAFVTKETFDSKDYLDIFKNYFISEVELARDGRKTPKNNGKELRFFKDILGENYKEVWNKESAKLSPEELYDKHEAVINKAVETFIKEEAKDTRNLLDVFGITKYGDEGLTVEDLNITEDEYISEEELTDKLNVLSANYIISNIEMHKLLYSDPYQYKDELKRIKNFNSPRQALLTGSPALNTAFNKVYNKLFSKDDLGYTDMTQETFRSSVIADVFSKNDLEGYDSPYEETDGGGYISLKANRIFGIRSGEWTPANEAQYRYDIAYEKTVKGEGLSNDEKKKKGLVLTKEEENFNIKKITKSDGTVLYKGKNPNIKSTYTTRKPIVSGSKADGKNYNDVVLDKFALTPLSFRVLHELNPSSNALKLYDKMQNESVDYVVYSTGRKVGAGLATPLYKVGGEFNTDPFEEINNIPFSIMGVQAEVPSKETAEVTQGSQITKLVTLDMMEAGMPIDFMPGKDINARYIKWLALEDKGSYNNGNNLYNQIKNNQKLLEEKIEVGYKILLKKLGIKQVVGENGERSFEVSDADKLINTLTDEILKREVNENIIEAFEQFKQNKNTILEATPAYQQIRNILYSIADKNITSQKISGGSKVQVSSALLESVRAEGKEFIDKNGNVRYSYQSDDLKFYSDKDGSRVCEIMIGRWFKSSMSDAELLDYLNNTEEGQKILGGIAFRTPTQKQNSIDVFKVKQFLPESFGDNVIVPSALVKKAGSDFDIDKLSIYLKNIIEDAQGRLKLVTRGATEEESKKQYEELYREKILSKFDKVQNKEQFKNSLLDVLAKIETIDNNELEFANDEQEKFFNDNKVILQQIINQAAEAEVNPTEYIKDQLAKLEGKKEDLVSKLFNTALKEEFVDSMYKKAIENEYIQSLEDLVSHPLNFSNLIKPNSAQELNDLSDEIVGLLGEEKIDYSNVGNMLNRRFMSQLRQDFVSGKYAIGIAATAQTNHSQNQRSLIFIDSDRILGDDISDVDKKWLNDGKVKLPHNTIVDKGIVKSVLSMINNKDGRSISDIIGQFIDGFVDIAKGPWIMKLGATPNVAGTWLFLTKIGVPIKTTAYFMNQPIIRDYLRNIQSDGYSYLFMDNYVNDMMDVYTPQKDVSVSELPSEGDLRKMIGKKTKDLSDVQKSQQQLVLLEFLKYAKMAEHLFKVQQASNFDTATFNDSFLIFKKKVQLEQARKTIISSVDDLLENSFVNVVKNALYNVRDAFSTILLSDKKGGIRNLMESVLLPYVNMNDRDFLKISRAAVNTMFDWAMLNDTGYNKVIIKTLLGTDTEKSAARQIIEFRDNMISSNNPIKDNLILKSLKLEAGEKFGKVDNLYIAGRDNKMYDQNLIIDAFRQLKEALGTENKDLYGKLVRVAILQSGLTTSPISFTSLLPYEDFNEIYNNSLSKLEKMPTLGEFKNINVLERTNWSNSEIVPFKNAKLVINKRGGLTNINEDFVNDNLKKAFKKGDIQKVINISAQSLEGRSDIITYSWQTSTMQDPNDPEKTIAVNKKTKADARRRGDYSYIKKGLFQKVYTQDENGNTVPLLQITEYNDKIYINYVYKMINAWGDSFKANESYSNIRPSKLDNGYEKVIKTTNEEGEQVTSGEVVDNDIVTIFEKPLPVKQKMEDKSIVLKGGVAVSPSELSEGLLDYLGYSPDEIKEVLNQYKPNAPEGKPSINRTSKECD